MAITTNGLRVRPPRQTLFELRVVDVRLVVYRVASDAPVGPRVLGNRYGDRLIGGGLVYRGWCASLMWRRL